MRKRIGAVTAFALIAVAILIDGLQALISLRAFIPVIGLVIAFVLGVVVDILAILLFAIWFSHINVSLMTRYPLGFLATIVLENVPVVNSAPGWTWFVVTTIARERLAEDSSSGEV